MVKTAKTPVGPNCAAANPALALWLQAWPLEGRVAELGSTAATVTEKHEMRIAKNDIPVRINAPGAVARQKTDFADATGYGKISGEYFSLGKGEGVSHDILILLANRTMNR